MIQKTLRVFILYGIALLLLACNYPSDTLSQDLPETKSLIELTITPIVIETPTPTAENTPTPIITPPPDLISFQQVAVVFVSEGDDLVLRAQAGEGQLEISKISPHAQNIHLSKAYVWEDDRNLWVEIITPDRIHGWVNARYLTNQIPSDAFCLDSRVNDLIKQFEDAIVDQDSEKLAGLVSPYHGLAIRHEWWNPEIQIGEPYQIKNIFTSDTSYNWGFQDGSGLPITGSFKEVILPLISEVVNGSVQHCNTLEQGLASGGSTGFTQWPFEYANFNYVSLYHPAPQGDELKWRTWAIGIEFIGDKAYVVTLVQYHWEI